MGDPNRRGSRLGTLGSARLLGSVFVLIGICAAFAALLIPVWQDAVVDGTLELIPAVDELLRELRDVRWIDSAIVIGCSLLLVALGYVLKVLAIIGETQFVDFGMGRS